MSRVAAVLSSVAITSCSVVGIRDTDEPHYSVVQKLAPGVEVREYGPQIVAETVVASGQMQARYQGFQRLAGYIFGGNTTGGKIAMTAPVVQAQAGGSATIPMTAPVVQAENAGGGWRIEFVMPAGSTLQSLPKPNDTRVTLREIPAQTYAVLRFSGDRGPGALRAEEARLGAVLAKSDWHATGGYVAWFYDPPWTLPWFRRNEVAVTVARS